MTNWMTFKRTGIIALILVAGLVLLAGLWKL